MDKQIIKLEQELLLEKAGSEKLNQKLCEIDEYLTRILNLNCSNTTTIMDKIKKLEASRLYLAKAEDREV
jgi:hypothetical protein